MLLQIADILDQQTIAAMRDALAGDDVWINGKETAFGRARAAKTNQQALAENPNVRGVLEKSRQAILDARVVRSAAQPEKIARLIVNRYGAGMAYGAHTDAPYIDGIRTDLSFTLFLSEPEEYDGGELIVDTVGAEDSIKLPAGAMALYPSTSVHRVETVSSGERIAIVGWIKSRIKSPSRRALLFDLDRAITELAAARHEKSPPVDATMDRLTNVKNNLLRDFGD